MWSGEMLSRFRQQLQPPRAHLEYPLMVLSYQPLYPLRNRLTLHVWVSSSLDVNLLPELHGCRYS